MLAEGQTGELTRRLFEWEGRGRGVTLYPLPVALEPPFRPFRHYRPSLAELDDARHQTLFSWIAGLFKVKPASPKEELESEPKPAEASELVHLRLYLPRDFKPTKEAAEGFLGSLRLLERPLSWELSGEGSSVRYRVALTPRDRPALEAALTAYLPGTVLSEDPASFDAPVEPLVSEFALAREFMVPLGIPLQPDPLLPLLSVLSQTAPGENLALQILFTPARRPWRESILRAVRTPSGEPFFKDAPEVTKLAEEKVSTPLFAVALRLAASAPSRDRRSELARLAAGALGALGRENHLIPLSDNPHAAEDFRKRETRRAGIILSLRELAALVRLPGPDVHLSGIERGTRKEKEPPPEALGAGVFLGETSYQGRSIQVFLPEAVRLRHTLVLGATGTGKTTLLRNLILEDIREGRGVAAVDPHGDLAAEVLARIPQERLKDLHLLDPSDPDLSTGWNALEARSEREREVLSSDLVSLFKRYATSWGDQMGTLLSNAVAALLSLPGSYTISDLRRFLVDRSWRESLVPRLADPEIQFFWKVEVRHIGEKSLGPILGRLNTFLRSRPVRESVSRSGGIDFRKLLDQGEILIARLPLGTLGEENTAVIGSLLISKIHQAALSRADLRPEDRRPFHLFLDEFQLFATPSLSLLLSGARKFGLGLLVASQSLGSLHSRFPEVEESLLSNAFTRILFRVGEEDAKKLERGLSTFDAHDLLSLRTGEAICRLGEKENDFQVGVPEPPKLSVVEESSARERVRAHLLSKAPRQLPEIPQVEESEPMPQAPPRVPVELPPLPTRGAERPTKRVREPEAPLALGRGGAEHQYLQALIKQFGEAAGFRVVIEKPIPGGEGRVDVSLERDDWSLACEISVSSTVEQEVGNIRKCLTAGFSEVAAVSMKSRFLAKLRNAIAKQIGEEELSRVRFFTPEEICAYIESSPGPQEKVETVGGYKVKVTYRQPKDGAARTKAIAGVIARSIRGLPEKR